MIVESRKERPACGCRFTAGTGLSAFGLRSVAGQVGPDRLVAGLVEWRAPLAEVGSEPEVDVGPVLDQVLGGLQVAFAGRAEQRCFVIGYDGVGVGAGFEQQGHPAVMPGPCR